MEDNGLISIKISKGFWVQAYEKQVQHDIPWSGVQE